MRNALVTGGSRGIGRAISLKLASSGFYVVINYKSNTAAAEDTLSFVKASGGSGEIVQFDISNKDEIRNFHKNWKNKYPENYIDVLVNNAGISADNLMIFMEDDQWESVINVNLNSFYYLTKALLTDMIVNKHGRIINIVSLSGQKGLPGQTNYSAAKAGVIGSTKALAQEVGKKKITVNAVSPGYIKTKMIEGLNENILKKLIPLNRFGSPEEVAEVVDFLASDRASYITGEVISVNGGLYT
ncbi:MAG: 3-oxoacyl-ACP reductase FabG [Bacteroidales bacterium]|nr:3-oxoacyl-ACP reductase FabG [Bacteroidales bacterium]